MVRRTLIFFILLFLTAAMLPANAFSDDGKETYKISVLSEFKPTTISVYNPGDENLVLAVDEELYPEQVISDGQHFELIVSDEGIVIMILNDERTLIKKKVVDLSSKISFATEDTNKTYNKYTLELNGSVKKDITGAIQITRIFNDFLIVAFIRKEQVIAELLDVEAGVYKSDEALKAQAVMMRTILEGMVGSHNMGRYDLCDLEHCRIYKYRGTATERALKAVRETNGEIITYRDLIIIPYYFYTCGGYTALPSVSSGRSDHLTPYIKDVKCDYCSDSKFYRYKTKIERSALSRVLLGRDDKTFDVEVIGKDKNDHWVDRVRIYTSAYNYKMKGSKFTSLVIGALGHDTLPSGAFSITKSGDEFIFSGKGSGHGVGFCQSGADKMATLNFDYKKMIKFYFPGVEVIKVD